MTTTQGIHLLNWKYDPLLRWWGMISLTLILLATVFNASVYFLAAVAGILLYVILLRKLERWMFVAIVLYAASIAIHQTNDITLLDIAAISFWVLSFLLWLISEMIHGRRILRRYDLPMVVTFVLAGLSYFAAVLFSTSLTDWMKELSLFVLVPMYIPMREMLRSPKKRIWLICAMVLAVFEMGAIGVLHYKERVVLAMANVNLYQLQTRNVGNAEVFFLIMFLFGAAVTAGIRQKALALGGIFFTMFCVGMLILSFGRVDWFLGSVGYFLILLLLKGKPKTRARIVGVTIVAATGLSIFFLYHYVPLAKIFFDLAQTRFLSSRRGATDISFHARVVESLQALSYFAQNPILGYGLGARLKVWEVLFEQTTERSFFHNSFLWLLLKLGIIGTMTYLTHYVVRLYHGMVLLRRYSLSDKERCYVAGAFIALLMTLAGAYTNMTFSFRDALLGLAFAVSILDWLWEKHTSIEA